MTARPCRTRIDESRRPGDRRLVVISLIVADLRAGMLTIRIAHSLDGQEVPPTPALIDRVEAWASANGATRSEAFRRLVELGLKAKGK